VLTQEERLHLFVHILDPEDYDFVRMHAPRMESGFRRDRVRIFRKELQAIARDAAQLHRERASNLAAAGRWGDYPALLMDRVQMLAALRKLSLAGRLFAWRLPIFIDAARSANRVLTFVTGQEFSPAHPNLPV
jgi:hypothetical protein